MALTFLEMQDQVLDIVRASSPEERGRAKRIINDVYLQVVQQALTPIKSSGAITLVNLQGDYDLSAAPFSLTDFIAIRTVIYRQAGSGPNNVLDQVTPAEIYDARNQIWSGFLYAFALEGNNKLMLVPSPSTSDSLTLIYNYRPALMATDSDTALLLDDEDFDTVIVGAAWRMSRFSKPEMSVALELDYKRRMGETQAAQNRKGGAAGLRLRVGTLRRPPHDRSTYPGGQL